MSERPAETRHSRKNAYPVVATGATLVGEMSAAISRELGKEPPRTGNIVNRERFRRQQESRVAGIRRTRDTLQATPGVASMTHTQASEHVQELARIGRLRADDQRVASREARYAHDFPTPEAQREALLAEVADIARRGDTAGAYVNTPHVRGKTFGAGYIDGQFSFRAPMDPVTPGRKANPVTEGISFTPARRNNGSRDTFVVVDYQFDRGGSTVTARVAVPPPLGHRMLAASVEDPGFGRDMASTILDTRALSIDGSQATDPTFAANPIGAVQVFDGITQGPLQETADKVGTGRLFLPAGTHIQYPSHAPAAV
ncbi:MAG TPA: hypothetical protein VLF62_01030 [Candidatus Saccharimonadales bacterium]|nr:hypothetical protein [Candidatus Saccharimonadales bacterium]